MCFSILESVGVKSAHSIGASLLGVILLTQPCQAGNQVLYVDVDAPPGGDGQSWATALNDLSLASDIVDPDGGGATTYGQVWVAEGTYYPTLILFGDPRNRSFIPSKNLAYLGGFQGNETSATQRDPDAHPTILDGDIGVVGNPADNSYHVIFSTSVHNATAIVDGFTLRNGNANASDDRGGGWYNVGGKPTVINCKFVDNFAAWQGAGMYSTSSPSITDCEFINNTGPTQGAAGLHTSGSVVTNCYFEGNSGTIGALSNGSAITNCVFIDNHASSAGGAAAGGFEYRNCSFINNTSTFSGGGALNAGMASQFHVVNCLFSGNVGGGSRGGAINAINVSSIVRVTNCTFLGNVAGTDGGAIALAGSDAQIANCLFSGNQAQVAGAVFYNAGSTATIVNCTVANNSASSQIGGIRAAANTNVRNCILWGNSANGVTNQATQVTKASGTLTLSYCNVQGWTGSLGGTGNNGNDPLFFDALGPDLISGTDDDQLLLQPGSAAIDSGSNTLVPLDAPDLDGDTVLTEPLPFDVIGNPRFFDDPKTIDSGEGTPPIVDRGSIEFDGSKPPLGPGVFVGRKGGSWFTPSNWAGGVVPDGDTDVVIPMAVAIDQAGAEAGTVTIQADGLLTIGDASLSAGSVSVQSGGELHMTHANAVLEIDICVFSADTVFEWLGGTVVVADSWAQPTVLSIGCTSSAQLILVPGSTCSAPSVSVCQNGTLSGTGTVLSAVTCNGTISPGASAGALVVSGSLTLGALSVLNIEVGGYELVEHDRLTVSGTATLNGTLDVSLLSGFQPQLAEACKFLQAGTVSGTFSNIDLPTLSGTFIFEPQFTLNSGRLLTTLSASGTRLYVDADVTDGGDGQTWTSAANDLQGALTVARTVDGVTEIWVASGSYKPDQGTMSRDMSFELVDDVSVYGGFAGGETELSQRNFQLNPTILTGDLAGNDVLIYAQNNLTFNENSRHLVIADMISARTSLDGFTLHGANGMSFTASQGGAVKNVGSNLTIANCIFHWNQADDGGGLANLGGNPIISNCTFDHNTSGGRGGGIFNTGGDPEIQNCEFISNSIQGFAARGAAMYILSSSPTITSCTFSANEGGAVEIHSGSQPEFINCDFQGNIGSAVGGAAMFTLNSTPQFFECDFTNNTTVFAGDSAGAVYVNGGGDFQKCTFVENHAGTIAGAAQVAGSEFGVATFTDCIFESNTAATNGGAVVNGGPFPTTYTNCEFTGNTAQGLGGASYHQGFANPVFLSCSFTGNTSAQAGGGIYHFNDGLFTLDQCTFSGNTAPIGSGIFNHRGSMQGNATLENGDDLLNGMNLSVSQTTRPVEITTIAVDGDYRHAVLGSTGDQTPVLLMDIAGLIPGTEHDVITANGLIRIDGGSLILNFIDDFEPSLGDHFDILTGGSIVGEFDLVGVSGLPDGLAVELAYNSTSVRATVIEGVQAPFSASPIVPFIGVPTDAATVDYDLDGLVDLAITVPVSQGPGNVLVFRNAGLDENLEWLGFESTPLITAVQTEPASIAVADLNGDNWPDLMVANRLESTVSVLRNLNGSGFLLVQHHFAGGEAPSLAAGQLVGTALIDFAVVNKTASKIRIYRNLGNFSFTNNGDLSAGPATSGVALVDLGSDADLDIVATNSNQFLYPPSVLSVHEMTTSFQPAVNYTIGRGPSRVLATKLDNDNLPDVVTANKIEESLSVLLGNPSAPTTFLPAINIPIGNPVVAMTSVDFDGDLDTDLVVVARPEVGPGAELKLVNNNQDKSSGQFQLDVTDFPTTNEPALVLSADIDNDDDNDLIIVNADTTTSLAGASSSVEVLLNETGVSVPGDVTGNGIVDVDDLLAVINAWGACPTPPLPCNADIAPPTGNGIVDVDDLLMVINNWG